MERISTATAKALLAEPQNVLPDQPPLIYEFLDRLRHQLPDEVTPAEFLLAADHALDEIQRDPAGLGLNAELARIFAWGARPNMGNIARKIFDDGFADEVERLRRKPTGRE